MKFQQFAIIFLLCSSIALATTFLPQSLDDLDKQADYIVVGTVMGQKSVQENKAITTQTTIGVEEWLKGFSLANTISVKELGGSAGDVIMIVPGSPSFEVGERVALFMKEDQPARWRNRVAYGHTVGMAQGKFSVQTDKAGSEMLVNDIGGAHLLLDKKQQPISFAAFRAKYKRNLFSRLLSWVIS